MCCLSFLQVGSGIPRPRNKQRWQCLSGKEPGRLLIEKLHGLRAPGIVQVPDDLRRRPRQTYAWLNQSVVNWSRTPHTQDSSSQDKLNWDLHLAWSIPQTLPGFQRLMAMLPRQKRQRPRMPNTGVNYVKPDAGKILIDHLLSFLYSSHKLQDSHKSKTRFSESQLSKQFFMFNSYSRF